MIAETPLTAEDWLTREVDALIGALGEAGRAVVFGGGLTPLHLAVQRGSAMLVRALMDAGHAVEVADDYGRTPLLLAAGQADRGQAAHLVLALLALGADPERGDHVGHRPIHAAARAANPEALKALLDAGADARTRSAAGESVRDLIEARGDLELLRLLRRYAFSRDEGDGPGGRAS